MGRYSKSWVGVQDWGAKGLNDGFLFFSLYQTLFPPFKTCGVRLSIVPWT